ncbi:MAG TPA: SagB/ThcOx family dehydrogenase [Vicinamibacteria bacterium]|nr:SagB/ThcOx family dehydrogenase [Vicinamibacteria bacterium]
MPQSRPRYRRSPHIVSYWSREGLVFHNYATGARVTATPLATRLLDAFDEWREPETLFETIPEFSRSSLREAVRKLARRTLLQRSDRPADAAERTMDPWEPWNPAAGFFHFTTKDLPYDRGEAEADAFLSRRLAQGRPPEAVKGYAGPVTLLTKPSAPGSFSDVLAARRTWRRFSRSALSLPALSTLLGLTFGIQGWVDLGELGRAPLKTSPSGGARHPIEAYVAARRVEGVDAGLYYYDPDRHGLLTLRRGATRRTFRAYLPGQPWYESAAVLILMTAVFGRTGWLYPHARSYRTVLLEAGHLCQTFCLTATALGLAPFCTDALADTRIERDLGLDGVGESVIYTAGVGARPAGVDWAPWPDESEVPRRFPPKSEARPRGAGRTK